MTRNMQLAVGLFIAIGLVLALTLNPLIAAYGFAGGALGVIVVVMGIRIARAVGDWRLEYGWGPRVGGRRRRPV